MTNMNTEKLEKDICYVIKEEQIKLGYRKETIRLYYQMASLKQLFGIECGIPEMYTMLVTFREKVQDRLGSIEISNQGERFCFCLPPQASEYVHENTADHGFLYDLISAVADHKTKIETIIAVFENYSSRVHVERSVDHEFDYLIYFEEGEPDDSYFCFSVEGGHLIYHRFSKEDYLQLVK